MQRASASASASASAASSPAASRLSKTRRYYNLATVDNFRCRSFAADSFPKSLSTHGLPRSLYLSSPLTHGVAAGSHFPAASWLCHRTTAVRRASSAPDSTESTATNSGGSLLRLGSLLALLYIFNIYFNIFNKQVLKVYPYPMTITTFQFAVGTILILFMWSTNIYRRPKISSSQLLAILPLAFVHTLGNIFTNVSLGKVAVSFTHTIKAMEPFFSVIFSAMFLGESPSLWVLSSLVPIVGGVALASITEVSFNWAGFWSAMASNVTNQSRNVLSKKLMVKSEESLDNITLFSVITVMSFFMSVPVTLFLEGIKFTPSFLQSAGLNIREIYIRSLAAGFCYHAFQQVAYMILALVSPVTHSVANCVKRLVVIVASVLFFKSPVSPDNALGTGVALAGVFLYSRVKNIRQKSI